MDTEKTSICSRLILPAAAISLLLALFPPALLQLEQAFYNSKFRLFEDYDISQTALYLAPDDPHLYEKLNSMRQAMTRPSLSFYLDKVRYKTYLMSQGVAIPTVYFMGQFEDPGGEDWMNYFYPLEYHEKVIGAHAARILAVIEGRRNYVAKVSHLSYGDGVVVIKDYDHNFLSEFGMTDEVASPSMPASAVAQTLASILHNPPTYQTLESWALHNVPPGLVVEERMTKPALGVDGIDDGPAVEFKTFTIWGKAFVSVWCQAGAVHGMVFRNGTARETEAGQYDNGTGYLITSLVEISLPDWVDWPQVVAISEKLGANKDMFRTDVFVGVPADGNRTRESIKHVVSEVEVHSTYGLGNLEQEVGRLWLQGYLEQTYLTVPNTEVQSPFRSFFSRLKVLAASTAERFL